MSATAMDGFDNILVIAFGVYPVENLLYWSNFLSNLKESLLITENSDIVLISDRDKGLIFAAINIIPELHHLSCVKHMQRNCNSNTKYDPKELVEISKILNINDFNNAMKILKSKNINAYNYLIGQDLTKWSTAYTNKPRFGKVTSNSAESLNNMIKSARVLPPYLMINEIIMMILNLFKERREKHQKIFYDISTPAKSKLEKNMKQGDKMRIQTTLTKDNFLVNPNYRSKTYFNVNIDKISCSCGYYIEYGIPCSHMCAVWKFKGLNLDILIHRAYIMNNIIDAYNGNLFFPDLGNLIRDDTKSPKESIFYLIKF